MSDLGDREDRRDTSCSSRPMCGHCCWCGTDLAAENDGRFYFKSVYAMNAETWKKNITLQVSKVHAPGVTLVLPLEYLT